MKRLTSLRKDILQREIAASRKILLKMELSLISVQENHVRLFALELNPKYNWTKFLSYELRGFPIAFIIIDCSESLP